MIYTAYTDFHTFGGAEIIAINLSKGLVRYGFEVTLVSDSLVGDFNKSYDIAGLPTTRYSFSFFSSLKNDDVIVSHHRKVTLLFTFMRTLLFKKYRIIHVAHNEFHSLKYFTFFPKTVVAISNRVKENLMNYFKLKPERIQLIYNGLPDRNREGAAIGCKRSKIKILVPARINHVKQQLEIVSRLGDKLDKRIEIHFAGVGEDLEKLKGSIKDKPQFKALGFVDIESIIDEYDYVMLFSLVEGLPTVFLEAFMFGKPIICNDVGGNLEILDDRQNGFFAPDFDTLTHVINSLPEIENEAYRTLCINARKKYELKYTFGKMVEQYAELLKI